MTPLSKLQREVLEAINEDRSVKLMMDDRTTFEAVTAELQDMGLLTDRGITAKGLEAVKSPSR